MTKKLFVGNLSFNTTEAELDGLFAQIGTVESVSIITDRMTGRSKGFGFVEMSNEDADNAIQKLNGQDFGGRALTVNEARPPVKRDFGGGGGGGGRGGGGFGGGRGGGGGGRDRGGRGGGGGGRDRY
jgi:cold-inducible RNA-binding protein